MADKKLSKDAKIGNEPKSGKGAGLMRGGSDVQMTGNARLRGEDPSPDDRRRGETSRSDKR